MNKFVPLALIATFATLTIVPTTVFAAESQPVQAVASSAAPTRVTAGKMLYGSNGQRIAAIYRVNGEGNPQVILNGRLVTVPASSLSQADGKVVTSLSKAELVR